MMVMRHDFSIKGIANTRGLSRWIGKLVPLWASIRQSSYLDGI